jgi:hypothetical protein
MAEFTVSRLDIITGDSLRILSAIASVAAVGGVAKPAG